MTDLASLYIKVDSKGVVTASKDLDNLIGKSKGAEKATQSVTKSFTQQIRIVKQLAAAYGAYKIAQYIKGATLLAARYETLGVVMHKVGKNAGYTGAQMDTFAKGLQNAGIAMVESRSTLARMIQAQINLTSSQELARIAQNAAVIGNLNSSEAFERMIYGLQTGHLLTLRTIGLNVDFAQSYKDLADELNKNKDQLSEAEIMQARVNAVKKAGVLIEGVYSAAMTTAGKKIASFTRYVQDFKVKMGLAFGPATVTLVDAATKAMKQLQEEIVKPEVQNALKVISSELADIVADLGQKLPSYVETITKKLETLWKIASYDPAIIEYGIVGLLLGGKKGAVLAGSLAHMVSWLSNSSAALGLVAAGVLDISQVANANFKELQELVDNFDFPDPLKAMQLQARQLKERIIELKQVTEGRIFTFRGDKEELIKLQDELIAVQLRIEAMKKAQEATKKAQEEATCLVAKAKAVEVKKEEDILKEWTELQQTMGLTSVENELRLLNIKYENFLKVAEDKIDVEQWKQNQILEIQAQAASQSVALYKELYEATGLEKYAEKAIAEYAKVMNAAEVTWGGILENEEDIATLRLAKEQEFADKLYGIFDDIVDAEKNMADDRLGVIRDFTNDRVSEEGRSSDGGEATEGGTGMPTGRSGSTWATYQGWLTPGVVEMLDRNQRAIENAPKIAKAAAEAAVALQRAADEAQRAADEARRVAEREAQRLQRIADQRIQLEIELLEATGYAEEALGVQRLFELEAMDESLRPLQQRLYYLEDEARAAEEAAEATKKLIREQDRSIDTWRDSIAMLVSQGMAIEDFINSLGATGVAMSFSAARSAYMSDLAGAQAGDVESYNRITQSAGTYISTATQTAGSRLELARIVAGIKNELSALQPVVDLDSNIELLKAIREATKDTATATQRLDVLGIKAIFDLDQVMHFIEDSTGLDPALRDLIFAQTADYQIFIQAQLDVDVDSDIKRILIEGVGIYDANVRASLGYIDETSRKLVIDAQGDYITTVEAALGFTDPGAVKLALETSNTLLATVTAAVATGDPEAILLATQQVNHMQAVIEAALAQDATTQQFHDLLTGAGLTTTVDGTMSWNPNDPLKAIWDAIKAATQATADNTGKYAAYSQPNYYTGVWTVYSGSGATLSQSEFGLPWEDEIATALKIQATSPQFATGGIATGPESGYEAILHGTELVVSPSASYPATVKGADSPELLAEVKKLREEIKAGNFANVKNSSKIAKIITRFDDDGIPAERTI